MKKGQRRRARILTKAAKSWKRARPKGESPKATAKRKARPGKANMNESNSKVITVHYSTRTLKKGFKFLKGGTIVKVRS